MSDFEEGRQPCKDFEPEDNFFGQSTHECFCKGSDDEYCSGQVSWCMNCHKDHHKGGYEACKCRTHPIRQKANQ